MTIYSLDVLLSPFGPVYSISSSNCCLLTCTQISQEAGKVIWYSHLFKNFSQFVVIHIIKGFGIVNKAEVDVFLELSCFFSDLTDVGNLISPHKAHSRSRGEDSPQKTMPMVADWEGTQPAANWPTRVPPCLLLQCLGLCCQAQAYPGPSNVSSFRAFVWLASIQQTLRLDSTDTSFLRAGCISDQFLSLPVLSFLT